MLWNGCWEHRFSTNSIVNSFIFLNLFLCKMVDQRRIDELVRFYTRFSAEERTSKATTIGNYRPTRIDVLKELFEKAFNDYHLQPHFTLVDAGGGDGRVAALGALYDLRTYSIEGDLQTHALAEKRIAKLQREGILPYPLQYPYPVLAYGNVLELPTYVKLRLRPHAVDIFFATGDNEAAFTAFVRRQTKPNVCVFLTQSEGSAMGRIFQHVETYRDNTNRLQCKIFSGF